AFRLASREIEEHYTTRGQISTEHAILDDNGDNRGTRREAMGDDRLAPASDGLLARTWHLVPNLAERSLTPQERTSRDALELAIDALRHRKRELTEDQYYRELEMLLIPLARLMAESPLPVSE
ncbi:MAG: hypothetical protein R3C01_13455, partial [Planctomycetaceae bacterium]